MDTFETKLFKASEICEGHFKYLDKYLEENCAVECKYFVVKKIKDER